MARGDASGVEGGVHECSCGCGATTTHSGEPCGCGCSTAMPKSTMDEVAQLEAQRDLIDKRLQELWAS